jgi:uncharacterized protein
MKDPMETPVTFKSQGMQIVGMLHMPDRRKGKIPAVILFHGFTGTKIEPHRIFVKQARALAKAGIAALRFDFRGSGDSEGEFSNMTLTGELKDARAALDFMRSRPGIDQSRIGVLGLSFGGAVAALLLGSDTDICAAALWAPVGHPSDMAQHRYTAKVDRQLKQMGCVDYGGNAVGKCFFDDVGKHQPIQAITRSKAPVLLVHGSKDQTCPVKVSREYESALKKARCVVMKHIITGADHTFNSLQWEVQVLALTLEWFRCNFAR